jgi:hypothetical protein
VRERQSVPLRDDLDNAISGSWGSFFALAILVEF